MGEIDQRDRELDAMRTRLRSLGNRYAIEILQVLNPEKGDIIQNVGWDEIVEGLLELMGFPKPDASPNGIRSGVLVKYEERKKKFAAGGTLYESMNKLVKAGYVQALGTKGKKQRTFMITHEGRLALSALGSMLGPSSRDTEAYRTAKILLRHKNFVRLLPAQEKFLNEVRDFDGNILIQMPPGSGKTFLAMIAVLMKLQKGMKCLYLSPYLSIITQVINEYGELLEELGYSIQRHDGSQIVKQDALEAADLIVGVYESVLSDILQRDAWTEKIGLTVVDELSELDSPIGEIDAGNLGTDRSAKLDCLVTLLKRGSQIITLSSRFGDTEDVALWLDAKIFRPNVRLTPDEFIAIKDEKGIRIYSSDGTQNVLMKREYLLESIIEHVGNYNQKSILFVASSRNQAEWLAGVISRHWPRPVDASLSDFIVGPDANLPVASRLYQLLKQGIAFHHAGLSPEVRRRLEEKIKIGAIRTVVSTTGITAGISFPFDSVVILFDRIMDYLAARSRYLQVAGRIGEYHLAEHGGSVYLVFEEPSRRFQDAVSLEETLLHKPLEPISPGPVFPSILANIMTREIVSGRKFTREKLETSIFQFAKECFRSIQHDDYQVFVGRMFSTLFAWLVQKRALQPVDEGFKLTKEVSAATKAGLDIIRYLEIQHVLDRLQVDVSDDELVDIILSFGLPQIVRPRTSYPTSIELAAAGLEKPSNWYDELTKGRNRVKKEAIIKWISELNATDVIVAANEVGRNIIIDGRNAGGLDMDEGDFDSLIKICGGLAEDLSQYFNQLKKKAIANRFDILSRQLLYGVRADLAKSDLLELKIPQVDNEYIPISRGMARALFDRGYKSISDILRKDRDPEKKGLVRDRFARNSGLDQSYAKEVYKAALAHVRARLEEPE